MTDIERLPYDVVVIGAGGSGLRAAIEARQAGKRTAIISKSLFGKAHTVMAEGGCAAAMGNVNPNDNWQVHFRDTMRGGKFLNNWRMAELHAKEAPDRVWELEAWGALFDRTPDGKISQRNFGGHEYPRLAHVGDRTGLEMIRTLQQKVVALQQEDAREHGDPEAMIKVFAETTITRLVKDGGRIAGAFGYIRESGRFVCSRRQRSSWPPAGSARPSRYSSNSWEYTGDGHALALLAGAELLNMEFVQFHPTHMVWPLSVRGPAGHRVGPRRRRRAAQLRGQAVHVRLRARRVPGPVRGDRGGGRPLVHRPGAQPAPAGAAAPRRGGPCDQRRGQGRPRVAARRRVPRHRLPAPGRGDPAQAAVHVPPVQGAGRRRHHQGADGGRPGPALRDGRRRGGSGHRRRPPFPACSRPARCPAACTAPTGSAATRCPTCWCSAAGPAWARRRTWTRWAASGRRPGDAELAAAQAEALAPLERTGGENPYTVHAEVQQTMSDLVGIIRKEDEIKAALAELDKLRERAAQVSAEGGAGLQPRLAPGARPAQHHADRGVCRAGGAGAPGEPGRAHPRRLPRHVAGVAQGQPGLLAGRRPGGAQEAADAPDARGPARAVRPGRAEEVPDREELPRASARRLPPWRGDQRERGTADGRRR